MKKNSSHKTLSIVKRISITNIGIFIIACILSIVATLKLNVEYHIDRDAQMMKVYISNTLSSIDNTLKDMGRVSLIAFSDQTVQDILKGTDYSFDEKMENEEYLKKLYYSIHLVIIVYSYLLFCYTPFKKQFWRIRNATLSCYTY